MRSSAAGHFKSNPALALFDIGSVDVKKFSSAEDEVVLKFIHAGDLAAGGLQDNPTVVTDSSSSTSAASASASKEHGHSGGWFETLVHLVQNECIDQDVVLPLVMHFLFAAGDVFEVCLPDWVIRGKPDDTAIRSVDAADFVTIRETSGRGHGETTGMRHCTHKHIGPASEAGNPSSGVHRVLLGVHGDMLGHQSRQPNEVGASQLALLDHYVVLAAVPVPGDDAVRVRNVIHSETKVNVVGHLSG